MYGLPLEVYTRCRNILLRCDEFRTNERLHAVFVTGELTFYRNHIPEPSTIGDRVEQCLDFLLGKRWGGEPVLALFLEALRSRYGEDDDLHKALTELARDVRLALTQTSPRLPETVPLYAVPPPALSSDGDALRAQMLFSLILELDFNRQVEHVDAILQQHRVAAFLIHGDPDYGPNCGQALLVERLFYLFSEGGEGHRIQVNVGSPGVWAGLPSLWRQIAKYLELADTSSPDEIVDKVYQGWLTQNMVFIFYQADYLVTRVPTYLARWIKEFWQKLAAKALSDTQSRAGNPAQNLTYLLLFLVDYSGHVCLAKDVHLARAGNDPEYPKVPLRLPPNKVFPREVLTKWLRQPSVRALLPRGITVDAQQLWQEAGDGVPELVYKRIFDYYQLSWEGLAKKWLT
jgi:Bacterial Death-like domain 1/inactive STAND